MRPSKLRLLRLRFALGILPRTTLLSWLLIVVTLGIFIAMVVPSQKRAFQQNLASKAQGVSASLLGVTAGAAVSEDYSTVVEHCLKMLSDDPSIKYLILTRKDGFSLIHRREGWEVGDLGGPWLPPDRRPVSQLGNDDLESGEPVFRYSRPFSYSGIEWGWIHVGLSLDAYQADVADLYRRSGLAMLLCVVFGLFASILYARKLTNPIIRLRRAVQRLAGGDLSVRAVVRSRDEFGDLAHNFNLMAQSLLQRAAILNSVRFSAQQFLAVEDWRDAINDVLKNMASATEVSRVYVYQVSSEASATRASREHEWATADTSPDPDDDPSRSFVFEGMGMEAWVDSFRSGRPISGDAKDVPADQHWFFEARGTKSMLAVPILVDGEWWGFIGLDDCRRIHPWSDAELSSLQAAADTLGAAVERHRAREALVSAKETAVAANKAKSQFLANMSHEIRTPITGVVGMTHLLQQTVLTRQQTRYVENAATAANALLTIIGDILDFSKIEMGRIELVNTSFSLPDLVDGAVRIFAGEAERKQVDLIYRIDDTVPREVYGDDARVRQVLVNLLSNAIKFTEEGEILLECLTESTDGDDVLLRFEIRDTGCGIDPSKKDSIFEAFYQADNSMSRSHGGAGLGLAISQELCHQMGGSIGFESVPHLGSCFWFTIKVRPLVTEAHPPPALIPLNAMRLIVISSSDTTREVICDYVRRWRGSVDIARTDREGLARLQSADREGRPYQVAVIDCDVPDSGGIALGSLIRQDARLDKTEMVLLTSFCFAEDSPDIWEAGFSATIPRPVRQSDLYDSLVSAGNRNPAHDQETIDRPLAFVGPLKAKTILLVEDNEINQQVGMEMIRAIGCEQRLACNGVEALESVIDNPPDLILMDCQMPIMDGYEATRRIRAWESTARTRPIPIVALTAHATPNDRDECLEAGMDDFLSKPMDPRVLAAMLRKWLSRGRPETDDTEEEEQLLQTSPPAAPAADPLSFSDLTERCMGKEPLARTLVQKFLVQVQEDLKELTRALDSRDLESFRSRAHRLKGSAASVCADPIRAVAEKLESSGAETDRTKATELLHDLETLIAVLYRFHGPDPGESDSDRQCA